jgi:hypothetical protein
MGRGVWVKIKAHPSGSSSQVQVTVGGLPQSYTGDATISTPSRPGSGTEE